MKLTFNLNGHTFVTAGNASWAELIAGGGAYADKLAVTAMSGGVFDRIVAVATVVSANADPRLGDLHVTKSIAIGAGELRGRVSRLSLCDGSGNETAGMDITARLRVESGIVLTVKITLDATDDFRANRTFLDILTGSRPAADCEIALIGDDGETRAPASVSSDGDTLVFSAPFSRKLSRRAVLRTGGTEAVGCPLPASPQTRLCSEFPAAPGVVELVDQTITAVTSVSEITDFEFVRLPSVLSGRRTLPLSGKIRATEDGKFIVCSGGSVRLIGGNARDLLAVTAHPVENVRDVDVSPGGVLGVAYATFVRLVMGGAELDLPVSADRIVLHGSQSLVWLYAMSGGTVSCYLVANGTATHRYSCAVGAIAIARSVVGITALCGGAVVRFDSNGEASRLAVPAVAKAECGFRFYAAASGADTLVIGESGGEMRVPGKLLWTSGRFVGTTVGVYLIAAASSVRVADPIDSATAGRDRLLETGDRVTEFEATAFRSLLLSPSFSTARAVNFFAVINPQSGDPIGDFTVAVKLKLQ